MLKDPVCDMEVTEKSDYHAEHAGAHYNFDSSHCHTKI